VVVTAGAIEVTGLSTGASERLTPGRAALITPDEGCVRAAGAGDLFIALPGR
jgi:mannose-6-phosphate isomerase